MISSELRTAGLALVLAVGVLALDVMAPLGVAAGVPYVAVVLVALGAANPKITYFAAVLGSVFTVTGYVISPEGGISWVVLTNRGLALFAIWVVAILGTKRLSDIRRLEEQLHRSQRLEAIGQLTGGVAHEFNNLLMVIYGNLEMLGKRLPADDVLHQFVTPAMSGVQRGAELTQSLLTFSRKQQLKTVDHVKLNDIVMKMLEMLRNSLGEKFVVETELEENLWQTSTDPGQVESTLLNFVINARDAMPAGGVIIVRTANTVIGEHDQSVDNISVGDYVILEVRDEGTGMSDEHVARAFEPFFTTKEVGAGTGLGLSVAYGFARQSRGTVLIHSEIDKGTSVRLVLPGIRGQDADAVMPDRELEASPQGNGKVLVVEDDAEVREIAVAQLIDLGYVVLQASDADQALAIFAEHQDIDLLFLDVVLPGPINGPEIASIALSQRRDLKVLFATGYPQDHLEDLAIDGVEMPVLRKPYMESDLAAAVAGLLERRLAGARLQERLAE